MTPHPDIFISYCLKGGEEFYNRIVKSLEKHGFTCFHDFRDFDPIRGVSKTIAESIKHARFVLVCVTKCDEDANFYDTEISFAIQAGKEILVLVNEPSEIPIQVASHTRIEFKRNYNLGLEKLINKLQSTGTRQERTTNEKETDYLNQIILQLKENNTYYTQMLMEVKSTRKAKNPRASWNLRRTNLIEFEHHKPDGTTAQLTNTSELIELILSNQKLAIVGEPGAGKSTTLAKLTYELASTRLSNRNSPIPILVSLGDYRNENFAIFLNESFGELKIDDYKSDEVVILFDGLNELPTDCVENVQRWIIESENYCVISCRKVDYINVRFPYQQINIQPLNVDRIYRFIRNYFDENDADDFFWKMAGENAAHLWGWFRVNYRNPQALHHFWDDIPFKNILSTEVPKININKLRTDYQKTGLLPGLLEFAKNPYLLCLMCSIYDTHGGMLPTNRAELLNVFVNRLLDNGKKGEAGKGLWLDNSTIRKAMEILAFNIQLEGKGTIVDIEWGHSLLKAKLPQEDAQRLIYCAVCSGILEQNDRLKFSHQLLQEYLSASILIEQIERGTPVENFFKDDEWWKPSGWEETAIFSATMQQDSTAVIRWLTPANPTLAFLCTVERNVRFDKVVLEDLYEPQPGARTSPLAKAEWGDKLASNGDKRLGVGCDSEDIPLIDWIHVPSGSFHMGGDKDCGEYGCAWSGMAINFEHAYWISKYTITGAQFDKFVREGYNNPAFWSEVGYRKRSDQETPYNWQSDLKAKDNQPVTDISWHEAYAFCNWLNAQLSEKLNSSFLTGNFVVRLPTEAEWEYAARFPDNRSFPWGNDYKPGFANIDETAAESKMGPFYLGRKTAVGMYPQGNSYLGISDMCGNTWEWCLSNWTEAYQYPEKTSPEEGDFRLLKGGSWLNSATFGRSATRDHFDNDLFVCDIGFRIVFSNKL